MGWGGCSKLRNRTSLLRLAHCKWEYLLLKTLSLIVANSIFPVPGSNQTLRRKPPVLMREATFLSTLLAPSKLIRRLLSPSFALTRAVHRSQIQPAIFPSTRLQCGRRQSKLLNSFFPATLKVLRFATSMDLFLFTWQQAIRHLPRSVVF